MFIENGISQSNAFPILVSSFSQALHIRSVTNYTAVIKIQSKRFDITKVIPKKNTLIFLFTFYVPGRWVTFTQ